MNSCSIPSPYQELVNIIAPRKVEALLSVLINIVYLYEKRGVRRGQWAFHLCRKKHDDILTYGWGTVYWMRAMECIDRRVYVKNGWFRHLTQLMRFGLVVRSY